MERIGAQRLVPVPRVTPGVDVLLDERESGPDRFLKFTLLVDFLWAAIGNRWALS
jgi:hypothetical protein